MDDNYKIPEFMFLELKDQIGNALRVDYDGELIDDLVKNDGWLEFVRQVDKGEQHYIFSTQDCVIRNINWCE